MSNQEEKKDKWYKSFIEKLKRIKHLDIILCVLFVSIILLIYFSSFGSNNLKGNSTKFEPNITYSNAEDLENYSLELTRKTENLISAVKGAGNVKVMLYFTEGIQLEIAYKTETKVNSDGSKLETKSPILIKTDGKDNVVILKKVMPKPSSIIIVATGAKDTNVKLEIARLVESMFELSTSKIEIFIGN